jgi:hypothetical protein
VRCKQLVRGACPTCDKPWVDRPPSWSKGGKAGWFRFRHNWLKEHPWCMDCGAKATRVCHRFGTDYSKDRCNPAAIEGQRCEPCDLIITSRQGNEAKVRRR